MVWLTRCSLAACPREQAELLKCPFAAASVISPTSCGYSTTSIPPGYRGILQLHHLMGRQATYHRCSRARHEAGIKAVDIKGEVAGKVFHNSLDLSGQVCRFHIVHGRCIEDIDMSLIVMRAQAGWTECAGDTNPC